MDYPFAQSFAEPFARTPISIEVGSEVALGWAVRGAVGSEAAMDYAVRGAAGSEADLAWAVRGAVGSRVDLAWNIEGALERVGSRVDLGWFVRASAGSDTDLAWKVRGAVTATAEVEYLIRGTARSDFTARYAVRAPVGSVKSMSYAIREPVRAADAAIHYAVRAAARSEASLAWNVRAKVGNRFEANWKVAGVMYSEYRARWRILGVVGERVRLANPHRAFSNVTGYGNAAVQRFPLRTGASGKALDSGAVAPLAAGDVVDLGFLQKGMRLDDALVVVGRPIPGASAKLGFVYEDGADDPACPMDEAFFFSSVNLAAAGRSRSDGAKSALLPKPARLVMTMITAATGAGEVDVIVYGG